MHKYIFIFIIDLLLLAIDFLLIVQRSLTHLL